MPDLTRERIKSIFCELMRENPMSVNAILSICGMEFTDKVTTLAVTLGKKPVLRINEEFVRRVCLTDEHIKALLFHEFLHVLLGHCLKEPKNEKEFAINNIAFDAVINAIIHRQFGESYSSMMSRYYADSSYPLCLLRRPEAADLESKHSEIWRSLYKDKVVSRDIQELLKETMFGSCRGGFLGGISGGERPLKGDSKRGDNCPAGSLGDSAIPGKKNGKSGAEGEKSGKGEGEKNSSPGKTASSVLGRLLGNHSGGGQKIPEGIKKKIERILNSGASGLDKITGVKSRGVYDGLDNLFVSGGDIRKREWEIKAYNILRKLVIPEESSSLREKKLSDSIMPVLSQKDRRAFLKALWNPFIPFSTWDLTKPAKTGSANVYLDVSGSMSNELPLLVKVLFCLSPYIKKPLWGFSNDVSEAVIKRGKLCAKSTFGTDLVCVIKHIIETKPRAAVIVTDGFVGAAPEDLLKKALSKTKIAAIISKRGNPEEIKAMGIKCHMIEGAPRD